MPATLVVDAGCIDTLVRLVVLVRVRIVPVVGGLSFTLPVVASSTRQESTGSSKWSLRPQIEVVRFIVLGPCRSGLFGCNCRDLYMNQSRKSFVFGSPRALKRRSTATNAGRVQSLSDADFCIVGSHKSFPETFPTRQPAQFPLPRQLEEYFKTQGLVPSRDSGSGAR